MITASKTFDNFPAAHRQPRHEGHCKLIHGHNWSFDFTFYAICLDDNGFVIDFGDLRDLRALLDSKFDHTLVVCADDPEMALFRSLEEKGLAKLTVVESASCEGLVKYTQKIANDFIVEKTAGRVRVYKVVCYEDTKNRAEMLTYPREIRI